MNAPILIDNLSIDSQGQRGQMGGISIHITGTFIFAETLTDYPLHQKVTLVQKWGDIEVRIEDTMLVSILFNAEKQRVEGRYVEGNYTCGAPKGVIEGA